MEAKNRGEQICQIAGLWAIFMGTLFLVHGHNIYLVNFTELFGNVSERNDENRLGCSKFGVEAGNMGILECFWRKNIQRACFQNKIQYTSKGLTP